MSFDKVQDEIIDLLSEGSEQQFIFLTGAAGTGKTTLLERVKNQLSLKKMVVAPTGIAALNIGGTTINSAFRIGFDTIPVITKSKDPRFAKLLRNLELLIIDEVSMVRAPMLDAISQSLQIHRNSEEPFGGVHVLACGDLFQLPPIIKESEERVIYEKYNSVYFFDAHSFKDMAKINYFELTESFRQEEDQRFCELLNNIRIGQDLESTINQINSNCFDPTLESDFFMTLTSRKKRAEELNEYKLSHIEGEEELIKSKESGDLNENDLPAPRELKIKVGANVMFIKNDPEGRWVNGTLGTVSECLDKKKKHIKVKINNKTHKVEREEWNKVRFTYDEDSDDVLEEVISSFKQFPIKLGWAVTIHKSQGLTLESCSVDLGAGAFATGQAYVALSRCKNLNSLNLQRELKVSDALVDPDIIDFHKNFIRN
ncbi:MAG: ATP-dependent RecD-like DNA helicase [Gammaproteobacteria bacterium]|tara:strand:- start:813 stop:2096 length:1284 start_codon:yes stop_codon:yes gene_type:complete